MVQNIKCIANIFDVIESHPKQIEHDSASLDFSISGVQNCSLILFARAALLRRVSTYTTCSVKMRDTGCTGEEV